MVIHYHEVVRAAEILTNTVLAVIGFVHYVSLRHKQLAHDQPHEGFIFDQQDPGAHSALQLLGVSGLLDNNKVKDGASMKELPDTQGPGLGHARLHEALLESCWNETLAHTTARLVHDFNNLLTGILSLSDAYLTQVAADNPLREGLALMNQNARQAVDVVQNLSRLYREKPGAPSYQNLNDLGSEYAALLRRILPRHTTTKFESATESLAVYIDPVEFRKVVLSVSLLFASVLPHSGEMLLRTCAPAVLEISGEVLAAEHQSIEGFFEKAKPPRATRAELVYDLAMDFLGRNGGKLSAKLESGRAIAVVSLRPSDLTELERDLAK